MDYKPLIEEFDMEIEEYDSYEEVKQQQQPQECVLEIKEVAPISLEEKAVS